MEQLAQRHRTWAEVRLANLVHNYRLAQEKAGEAAAMPVIKADAYGHGAVQAALALQAAGAPRFAVATPEEALQLRDAGIARPILLLGAAPAERVAALAGRDITLAVTGLDAAGRYAKALAGAKAKIHIKLDTGMSRLGLPAGSDPELAAKQALEIAAMPCFEVEGLFTHFAVADNPSEVEFTRGQYRAYRTVADKLAEAGLAIPVHHCANSAAILYHPGTHEALVRPGIMLYGYNPNEADSGFDLRPVLSWRCTIAQLKWVNVGDSVGYGRTWKAGERRLVATLPVGYADGLMRTLSSRGLEMLVRGQRAPLVGRICMDMCMLDVTDVPGVCEGDVVTLIGEDGAERLTADDMGAHIGTISYEILCAIAKRVPRYYYAEDGSTDGPRYFPGFGE